MTKYEVRAALCELADEVMRRKFDCMHPADCFCRENSHRDVIPYQFSEAVMDYIRDAVREKMTREGCPSPRE